MSQGGGQPAGISAGYTPGGVGAVNAGVQGNVTIDSSAIINAPSGEGIGLYNWGIGNISATLEAASSINAVATGMNVFAQGGGNVTIANNGTLSAPNRTRTSARTGTRLA